jgi:hypothetical protein
MILLCGIMIHYSHLFHRHNHLGNLHDRYDATDDWSISVSIILAKIINSSVVVLSISEVKTDSSNLSNCS